jgi:hypothetical protein
MTSCGMICIPSFMKTGAGVQAILKCCLNSLKNCNVGSTDGIDLCAPMRWVQVE